MLSVISLNIYCCKKANAMVRVFKVAQRSTILYNDSRADREAYATELIP